MHAIPLALATLSTTAAAINSFVDPFSLIVGPPAGVTPLFHQSPVGPALLGDKNTISIVYRQHRKRHNADAENHVRHGLAGTSPRRMRHLLRCFYPLRNLFTRVNKAREHTFI